MFISAGRTNRRDRLVVALSVVEIALHSISSVAVETLNGKRVRRVNAAGCKIGRSTEISIGHPLLGDRLKLLYVRALQMDQYKVCGRPRSASHRVISLQHFGGFAPSLLRIKNNLDATWSIQP